MLLTVGWSYVGNDVTPSTLLDRACACSYENIPKYRSYRVSSMAPGPRNVYRVGVGGTLTPLLVGCLRPRSADGSAVMSLSSSPDGWRRKLDSATMTSPLRTSPTASPRSISPGRCHVTY